MTADLVLSPAASFARSPRTLKNTVSDRAQSQDLRPGTFPPSPHDPEQVTSCPLHKSGPEPSPGGNSGSCPLGPWAPQSSGESSRERHDVLERAFEGKGLLVQTCAWWPRTLTPKTVLVRTRAQSSVVGAVGPVHVSGGDTPPHQSRLLARSSLSVRGTPRAGPRRPALCACCPPELGPLALPCRPAGLRRLGAFETKCMFLQRDGKACRRPPAAGREARSGFFL